MTSRATQRHRIAELTTPLGQDKLLLTSFSAHEGISQLYEIDIDCLSHDANLNFDQVIGKSCNIRLETIGKKTRHLSGILVEASWFGERETEFAYRLTLRPWFWLLTQTADCRIFQDKSVVDIIKIIFDEFGFKDYDFKLIGGYTKIEYCVQYRESYFNFISRLMEKFGLYYFFRHDENKHTLVVADNKSSHDAVPDLPKCRFIGMGERTRDNEEYLSSWLIGRSFQTGKVTVNAYDFASPKASMRHEQKSPGGYAHDDLEIYDYPEKYKFNDKDELGKKFAQARLYAAQSLDHRRQASGNAPSLYPGGLTTIDKHPVDSENATYLVVSASHSFTSEEYRSSSEAAPTTAYTGSYVLQPTTRLYKAPAVTSHPVISGPQTAVVVGPEESPGVYDEIHTDKYGRIKVKFHWDRRAKGDESSSRWVRVAQTWSGKAWGGIIVPRVGMEVVIEFIEGDPDRPLVVGTVYNGENGVPFDLPTNKTQSGMKTRSSKKGTDSHYNELVFEDKKDSEFVRFNAEKDLNSTIEDAETRLIKGKNKKEEGETTRQTTIERGDDVLKVRGDHRSTVGRHQELEVTKNRTVKVGEDEDIDVGSNQSIKAGKKITIEAGTSIVLKVGASTVTITGSSIEIKTPNLLTKSTFTEIKADAEIVEKAGMIRLN